MQDVPRDVQLKILRHLDIDSRRAIGVYCKLQIPEVLRAQLTRCLVAFTTSYRTSHHRTTSTTIALGTRADLSPLYVLTRVFGTSERLHEPSQSTFFLSRQWWNASVLDCEHRAKSMRCPIQIEYTRCQVLWDT
jgi:hypothetical protein